MPRSRTYADISPPDALLIYDYARRRYVAMRCLFTRRHAAMLLRCCHAVAGYSQHFRCRRAACHDVMMPCFAIPACHIADDYRRFATIFCRYFIDAVIYGHA